MRFGTLYSFQDPPESPIGHKALYDAALTQVARSEELGYSSAQVTEHHVSDDGYCPAVLPVLAAMAAVTSRLGLSTGMLILTLHQPISIAEQAAVVDVLSGGRLTLGIAAGYRRIEFEALGADYRRRGRRLEEQIEIILRSWTGKPFSYEGEHYRFGEVTVRPCPLQRPHPSLWLGGTSDPALRRAVRFHSACFPGATDAIDYVVRRRERHRELIAELDPHCPDGLVLPRLCLVADTTEEARRRAAPALRTMFETYASWGVPVELNLDEALRDWSVLDDFVIVGDEDYCAEQLDRYAQIGMDELFLQFAMPTLEPAIALESLERFATVAGLPGDPSV